MKSMLTSAIESVVQRNERQNAMSKSKHFELIAVSDMIALDEISIHHYLRQRGIILNQPFNFTQYDKENYNIPV